MNSAKNTSKKWLLLVILIPFLLFTAWATYKVYSITNHRAEIKTDFDEVNDIYYGLLNVNEWEKEIKKIAETQIMGFTLNNEQDSLLQHQVEDLLNDLITEAEQVIREDESLKGKLRKFAVNTFVDLDQVREKVPRFADAIIANITKDESKERIQLLAMSKLDELTAETYDSSTVNLFDSIYNKYDVTSKAEFNAFSLEEADRLEDESYVYTYMILGVMVFFLILWLFIRKVPELHSTMFVLSTILALIVLLGGLASPMIEVDARLAKLDLTLLGESILFENQMIFYRSKSIMQIVHILLESGGFDTIFVGFLILAFSILLPVTKIICMSIYTFKQSWRDNKVFKWFTFQSGKWSMADVIVVAAFMAYVSFQGILESQLDYLNRDTDQVSSITTNATSTQAGYIIFIGYVLFALLLSEILHRVVIKKKAD